MSASVGRQGAGVLQARKVTGHNSWWSSRMWVSEEAMCGRQLWPWAVSSLSGANVATMLQSLINMPRRFMAHHQIRKQDQGIKEPAWILMVPGKLGSSG